MIEPATPTSTGHRAAHPRTMPALAIGLVGAFALGGIARA